MEALHIDGHEIAITRPEKILFPGGATKGDLIRYYQRIGPWMLPHLEGRPLSMQRFPDGIEHEGFFQKAAASYYPGWIQTATVTKAGGSMWCAMTSRRWCIWRIKLRSRCTPGSAARIARSFPIK
jgi:bifunctional non-homologous end joining protein LigD